jgi:nicotinate-nucleotide adenylyltransferase
MIAVMAQRAIVLFGGTFDPIHSGHTAVAAYAGEQIGDEKVIFVPAKRSPLKVLSPQAGDEDRLKMIKLAILGGKNFEVSDYELKKPRPSFTIETVRHFQAEYGGEAVIYWLVGADGIEELAHWYKINELIDICNVAVMYRGGCEAPDFKGLEGVLGASRVEKLQRNVIKTPLINISSTEIRNRLAAGQAVGDMLHGDVAEYIRKKGLYKKV